MYKVISINIEAMSTNELIEWYLLLINIKSRLANEMFLINKDSYNEQVDMDILTRVYKEHQIENESLIKNHEAQINFHENLQGTVIDKVKLVADGLRAIKGKLKQIRASLLIECSKDLASSSETITEKIKLIARIKEVLDTRSIAK